MKLGRVVGTMVATLRAEGTEGLKLLIVQPLTAELGKAGGLFVATDASAQAGPGDLVTYEASREAALLHDPWFVPVDHGIVGIVDEYTYQEPDSGKEPSGRGAAKATRRKGAPRNAARGRGAAALAGRRGRKPEQGAE